MGVENPKAPAPGAPGHHDPDAQYLSALLAGGGEIAGLPPIPGVAGSGGLTNAVDWVVGWARANSLWPLVFGTSCCAIEMMATGASHNDWRVSGWKWPGPPRARPI